MRIRIYIAIFTIALVIGGLSVWRLTSSFASARRIEAKLQKKIKADEDALEKMEACYRQLQGLHKVAQKELDLARAVVEAELKDLQTAISKFEEEKRRTRPRAEMIAIIKNSLIHLQDEERHLKGADRALQAKPTIAHTNVRGDINDERLPCEVFFGAQPRPEGER